MLAGEVSVSIEETADFTTHEDYVDLFLIQRPAKVDIRPKKGGLSEDNVLVVSRHLGDLLGVHGRSVVGFVPWCSSPKATVQARWDRAAIQLHQSLRAPLDSNALKVLLRKFLQCLVRNQRVSRALVDEMDQMFDDRSHADHDRRMRAYTAMRARHFVDGNAQMVIQGHQRRYRRLRRGVN